MSYLGGLRGVLPGELGGLDGVAYDVVPAHGPESERSDADGSLADLGVPNEEAGREPLGVDLRTDDTMQTD